MYSIYKFIYGYTIKNIYHIIINLSNSFSFNKQKLNLISALLYGKLCVHKNKDKNVSR